MVRKMGQDQLADHRFRALVHIGDQILRRIFRAQILHRTDTAFDPFPRFRGAIDRHRHRTFAAYNIRNTRFGFQWFHTTFFNNL
ncbi:hypothetical protein D1872_294160 [compost metagenome]